MGLFKNLEGKKDGYLRLGTWKMLRKGLNVRYDFSSKRYLLKKHEVIHHLTEEDCEAIVKDLMGDRYEGFMEQIKGEQGQD